MPITIEKGIEHPLTHCDCCGRATRSLNGYANDEIGALASYFVHWTEGMSTRMGPTLTSLSANGAEHLRARGQPSVSSIAWASLVPASG